MSSPANEDIETVSRWCQSKGPGFSEGRFLGAGKTARVFEVQTPQGVLALKLFTIEYSSGEQGKETLKRIEIQKALGDHDCPFLVRVFDGGTFEGRHYLLMDRAQGFELETKLADIPRTKIRTILDQVTQAAQFLRARNMVHRDIKSANIFVSEDYSHTTLLDTSVVRDIEDPVGTGTDHGGHLPIVATARYSPPEYLFRLIPADHELWHALNIYQLGALLHDLIMRKPMFNDEFHLSATNRYRFAWIVATEVPQVRASDVPQDLVLLANRALDKNWQRRSTLLLDDFRSASPERTQRALEFMGLSSEVGHVDDSMLVARCRKAIDTLADDLDELLRQHLVSNGVTPTHNVSPIGNYARRVRLNWHASDSPDSMKPRPCELAVEVSGRISDSHIVVSTHCRLNSNGVEADVQLPELTDDLSLAEEIGSMVIASIPSMSVKIATSIGESE